MTYSTFEIWAIIILMGIGTFFLRFSFLGVVGDKSLPPFVLRILRYTAVAVLPGIVAPIVAWPAGGDGSADPARLAAAAVTLALGMLTRNVIAAIIGGAATLGLLTWLL